MSARHLAAGALLLAGAACGGSVAGTGGAGGHTAATATTTTATGGAGGAAPVQPTECTSDADCGGAPCVGVTSDGYKVCLVHIDPVTSCGPLMGCCNSDQCAGSAHCYPPFRYCGGIVGPQNKCIEDECQVNADCPPGNVCVPAGVFAYPVKACVVTRCHANADCTAEPGGFCEPVEDTCCAGIYALYCVYPGGCRTSADCPAAKPICAGDPATGAARCVSKADAPQCPI